MVPHLTVDFYVWTDPVGGGAPEIKDYVRHVRFWRLDYLNVSSDFLISNFAISDLTI